MDYKMQKALDDLKIAALEKLVEAQQKLIEAQQKELKSGHELIDKFCEIYGIDAPKWEG